jgi:hypothetical protein
MADESTQPSNSKNVKVSGAIEARFTPEFQKDIKAGQAQEHTRETNRFRVEIATLFIVLIYTTVAFWQGCSNQRAATVAENALELTRDQFARDRRPWIAQSSKSSEPPQFMMNPVDSKKGGQIIWNWYMTNYGKTPAIGVTFTQEISLGGKPFVRSHGDGTPNIGAPMSPSGEVFSTVISEPMQKAEFDKLIRTTDAIAIRVRIDYTDLEGRPYKTGFCIMHTNAGSLPYCKEDNYIN